MFSPFASSESRSCRTCASSTGTPDGWHLWCARHRIVVVYPCGLWERAAGVLLAIGFKARWAALGLAVFTVVASFIFHAWWSSPADQQYVQQLLFMKNMWPEGCSWWPRWAPDPPALICAVCRP